MKTNCPLCGSLEWTQWSRVKEQSLAKEYLKCAICSLVWLEQSYHPSAHSEKTRYLEHNNSLDSPSYLQYLKRLSDRIVRRLSPPAHGIDYGCGPVEGMRAILEKEGYCVQSYDPFFFPKLPDSGATFDFLLCSEAAEHFFRPKEEFDRMQRLLKPGGFAAFSSMLHPSLEEFPHWFYRRDPTHVVFYSPETLSWIAQHYGWNLLELDSPHWLFQKNS